MTLPTILDQLPTFNKISKPFLHCQLESESSIAVTFPTRKCRFALERKRLQETTPRSKLCTLSLSIRDFSGWRVYCWFGSCGSVLTRTANVFVRRGQTASLPTYGIAYSRRTKVMWHALGDKAEDVDSLLSSPFGCSNFIYFVCRRSCGHFQSCYILPQFSSVRCSTMEYINSSVGKISTCFSFSPPWKCSWQAQKLSCRRLGSGRGAQLCLPRDQPQP